MRFYVFYKPRHGVSQFSSNSEPNIYQARAALKRCSDHDIEAYVCPLSKNNLQDRWFYTKHEKLYIQANTIAAIYDYLPLTKEAVLHQLRKAPQKTLRKLPSWGYEGNYTMADILSWATTLPSIDDLEEAL